MRHPALVLVATLSALTGGVLWAAKSLAILVADSQPEYTFELALACFGISTLGIVGQVRSSKSVTWILTVLACVAALTGIASAVWYVAAGDNDAFSFFAMATAMSTLALLLYGGHKVKAWSVMPFYLGCLYVVSLPLGGALAAIDERLLEVPLLAIALGWIALAGRMASDTRVVRAPAESPASAG